MADYEEKGPKPTTRVQKVALGVAHISALLSVILVARWANGTGEGFLGGLDWGDKVSLTRRGGKRRRKGAGYAPCIFGVLRLMWTDRFSLLPPFLSSPTPLPP